MHVFLTGATGYVGSAIAEALLSAGHTVTGLARTEKAIQMLQERSIASLHGELKDTALLAQGAREADAVIHAAATNGRDMAQVDAVAVETMLATLAGTNKPFIYTSGSSVLGNTGSMLADEESPLAPPMMVAWRPAQEQHVLSSVTQGVRSVMIRPGLIYGHGGGMLTLLIQLAQQAGVARCIGNGENYCTPVQVDDLADAYVRALTKAPAGTLLNVAAGPAIPLKEIVKAAGHAAGKDGPMDVWPLEAAQQVLGPLADLFVLDQRISGAKTRHLLNWKPQAPSILEDLEHGSYATNSTVHS